MGYCQGMSDLVAPLLTEIQDESDTFWCFVGLMENTIFISSPRDEDMERQLVSRHKPEELRFQISLSWPCLKGQDHFSLSVELEESVG